LRAEAKKPIKSRKTGAKLYASTVSKLLVERHSSANDSFKTIKENDKTLESPVFSRVFFLLAFSGIVIKSTEF
jgi:hypothetical protein